MIKKVLITGGLGYIGTELCKLYSGFSWKYEVIGIDNDLSNIYFTYDHDYRDIEYNVLFDIYII